MCRTSTPSPARARETSASPQRVETISGSSLASSRAYVPVPVRTPTFTPRSLGRGCGRRGRRGGSARRRRRLLWLRGRLLGLRGGLLGLRRGRLRRGLALRRLLLLVGRRLLLVLLLRALRLAATEDRGPVTRGHGAAEQQLGHREHDCRDNESQQAGDHSHLP